MKIIGLTGKAGAGKSTVASLIYKLSGENVTFNPFAGKVKRIACMMGWDGRKDDRGRRLLQAIGQAGREYDPDIWIKLWRRGNGEFSIVEDVRFDNEAKEIRALGGVVVLVHGRSEDLGENAGDISERGVDEDLLDGIIENKGSIAQLETNVKRFLKWFGERHEKKLDATASFGTDSKRRKA